MPLKHDQADNRIFITLGCCLDEFGKYERVAGSTPCFSAVHALTLLAVVLLLILYIYKRQYLVDGSEERTISSSFAHRGAAQSAKAKKPLQMRFMMLGQGEVQRWFGMGGRSKASERQHSRARPFLRESSSLPTKLKPT